MASGGWGTNLACEGPEDLIPWAWRVPKTHPHSLVWSGEGPVALSCPLSLCGGGQVSMRGCVYRPVGARLQSVPAASLTPPGPASGTRADVVPREAVCCGCHHVFPGL